MEIEQFNDLKDSIRQMKAGESATANVRTVNPDNAVTSARIKLGLTQAAFAQLLDTPIGTVRGWEQGRRKPPPCAKLLMRVAIEHPERVLACASDQVVEDLEPVEEREAEKPVVYQPGGNSEFWML